MEASEQPAQEPQSVRGEEQSPPSHKVVQVKCGSCQAQFEFPIELNVESFGFDCTNCGAHNEVEVGE